MVMVTDLLPRVTSLRSASARERSLRGRPVTGHDPQVGRLLIKPPWWAGSAPVSRPSGQIPGRALRSRTCPNSSRWPARDRSCCTAASTGSAPRTCRPPCQTTSRHRRYWYGRARRGRPDARLPAGPCRGGATAQTGPADPDGISEELHRSAGRHHLARLGAERRLSSSVGRVDRSQVRRTGRSALLASSWCVSRPPRMGA